MFCKNNDNFFKYQIDVDWKFDKPEKQIQRHPTKSETRKIERKPKWTAALTHVTGGNIRDENELASYFATNPKHIGKKRLQFFCHTEGARFLTIWRGILFWRAAHGGSPVCPYFLLGQIPIPVLVRGGPYYKLLLYICIYRYITYTSRVVYYIGYLIAIIYLINIL